jgi:hypothetical protein
MLNLPNGKGRPGANPERPGDCKSATKPTCRRNLPPVPPLRKSQLARSPVFLPPAQPKTLPHAELVMGPPAPGDPRTLDERWTDWHADFEGWGPSSGL